MLSGTNCQTQMWGIRNKERRGEGKRERVWERDGGRERERAFSLHGLPMRVSDLLARVNRVIARFLFFVLFCFLWGFFLRLCRCCVESLYDPENNNHSKNKDSVNILQWTGFAVFRVPQLDLVWLLTDVSYELCTENLHGALKTSVHLH